MPDLIAPGGGAATNNALGVVEMRMPAGFSPPPHIHHNGDQAFYLLSGQIEAQLGDQKIPRSRARSCGYPATCSTASPSAPTGRLLLHPDL